MDDALGEGVSIHALPLITTAVKRDVLEKAFEAESIDPATGRAGEIA